MSKKRRILSLMASAGLMMSGALYAASADQKKKTAAGGDDVFYVYTDRGSRLNHYIPSGWMGDYGDLKLNQGWVKGSASAPAKGADANATAAEDTCIQIKYTAERKQGAGWAGIYWQHPANNWGDKKGGFNLSAYSKLTFLAKGEQGGEVIDKVFLGGITGQTEEGDSDEASLSPVKVTNEWKKYEIPLKGLDLSHIIGGFGIAANADANPDGMTVYFDEIKFEK